PCSAQPCSAGPWPTWPATWLRRPRRSAASSCGPCAFTGSTWPVPSAPFPPVGLRRLGSLSLEAAERRTGLVGQLRFAVTVQDLRTVIVLRRQLAQDRPRNRPWLALPGRNRFVVWRRGWHGLLRFPVARL